MPPFNELFLTINAFAQRTPWLHGPAAAYAKYGVLIFGALLAVGWWVARRRSSLIMASALLTPVGVLVAFGVQQLVVSLVGEASPYAIHPDALVLIAKTTDPSFPSDHACVTAAAAAGLFLVDRRLGWVASVLAVVMAVVRVYVGAHWPLDVIAGLALGAVVGATTVLALRHPVASLVDRLRAGTLRPLVATSR